MDKIAAQRFDYLELEPLFSVISSDQGQIKVSVEG
jgi:hypothetical protein